MKVKRRYNPGIFLVVISLGLFLLSYILINGSPFGLAALTELTGGNGIIDTELSYSPARAYEILDKLGPEGRDFTLKYITPLDIFFPASFCFFGFTIIVFLLKRLKKDSKRWQMLRFLPFLAIAFDYMENICIFIMLKNFPQQLKGLAIASGIFTPLKYLFYLATLGAAVLLISQYHVQKRKIN